MFKRSIALMLMVVLIATSFQRYLVYASLELNRNYIVKALCENRDKPQLNCNGKCYFMKKIHEADENEKKQDVKNNLSRLEVSFFSEPSLPTFKAIILTDNKAVHISYYDYQYTSHHLDAIFRPPKHTA